MPIKVNRDGQIVHRLAGSASVGNDKTVMLGYATVEQAGAVIKDDEVSDDFLKLVKDGEVDGVEYFGSEKAARESETPGSPEAQQPQSDQDLNPGRGGDDTSDDDGDEAEAPTVEYADDPDYDPDQHTQPKVLEYLEYASPEEVERVKGLESKGQNRQQIAAFEPQED